MFFLSKNGPKRLVVFLGNPGAEYKDTRHNVGFWTADVLAARLGVSIKRLKYSARTELCTIAGYKTMLLLPQTYMNRSGDAVYMAAKNFRILPEHILVVTDDVSLEPGRLRIRGRGSAGGHNGLKSIIMRLRSEDFPRIKIGVGTPPHVEFEMADWVLGKPRGQELTDIKKAVDQAADAIEVLLRDGVEAAQRQFNS